MVVGTGLLAQAFQERYAHADNVCIYAAGVSNSSCVEAKEFEREKDRLLSVIAESPAERMLVYFSTCSIYDLDRSETPYVKHKLAMEELIRNSGNFLIIRLPQAVGRSSNPHTLLNSFYNQIKEGRRLEIWTGARRNLLDVDDIERICSAVIDQGGRQNRVLNVANPRNCRVDEIVRALGRVMGKEVSSVEINQGRGCQIDVSEIAETIRALQIDFDDSYLERVLKKYYG